jgi:hypothetical protein
MTSTFARGLAELMAEASHLTRDHFHAFGHIVSTYAKVEQGFKFIIAKIIGVPRHVAVILCEPYTSHDLRNVVRSIQAAHDLPCGMAERITGLAKQFENFGPLRNAISHNLWREGVRSNSIKPMGLSIRSGKPKYKGVDDAERDWTLPELEGEALGLNALHATQLKVLDDLGAEHPFDT